MRCLWTLLALVALPLTATAGKVPATVNIGVGPTIGTVWMPSVSGPPPLSVGIALRAEGYVDKKTLHSKKVMRRVPKKYKGMVRSMDDLHVVPLPVMLIPDQVLVGPVNKESADQTVRGVGWTPVSLYLAHNTKGMHRAVSAAPRLGWVNYDAVASDDGAPTNHAYLGLDLGPELESPMKKKVGVAVGGNIGPGLVLGKTSGGAGSAATFGVWTDAYVRLQLRKPIKVKI